MVWHCASINAELGDALARNVEELCGELDVDAGVARLQHACSVFGRERCIGRVAQRHERREQERSARVQAPMVGHEDEELLAVGTPDGAERERRRSVGAHCFAKSPSVHTRRS